MSCWKKQVLLLFTLLSSTLSIPVEHPEMGVLKEGEACGLCTDTENGYDCGRCGPGLECYDETPNAVDDPMVCRIKKGNKQVGEVCGLCTDPEENYFCGHCEPGLECFDSTPNEIDNPMICRKIRDDSCENKLCGQACNWQLDVAGRCDKGGNCSLDYKHLGCSIHATTIDISNDKTSNKTGIMKKHMESKPFDSENLKESNDTNNKNLTELNPFIINGNKTMSSHKNINNTESNKVPSAISKTKDESITLNVEEDKDQAETKVISLRGYTLSSKPHSKPRHLSFPDYYSGFKIDEDHEIPEDEDPLEEAMEQEGTKNYEGDIALNAKEEEIIVNGTEEDSISMRAALREGHWPGNARDKFIYVPYTLSRDFDRKERTNIARAIEDYEEKTCIRFVERATVPREERNDFIAIVKGQGCNSKLGRRGGRQEISLGRNCADNVGTPIHEFLHALGFWHEQMRKDRDDYIIINWDNISPGTELQFKKCEACGDQGLEYDIGSVMHYHAYAFAKNKSEPTIIPKNGMTKSIGQRNKLSDLDIQGVNMMYCPDHESVAEASPCADKLARCSRWSTFCNEVKYPKRKTFMKSFCPGTCRICEGGCIQKDLHDYCEDWAGEYCSHQTWKGWMKINCGKSCGVCNM